MWADRPYWLLHEGPDIAEEVLGKVQAALDLVLQRWQAGQRGEKLPNAYHGP